jgi:transcription termination factor Rho
MTKAELESKHIAELHALAAEAGVPKYRMLRREELIEKLLDGKPAQGGRPPARERSGAGERSQPREGRQRPPRRGRERTSGDRPPRDRPPRERPAKEVAAPAPTEPEPASPAPEPAVPAAAAGSGRPRRKRRRRFGRKSKGLSVHDLLLPPPGRQALVYGETRAACTALLREVAGELSGASNGPDPIALLVDPAPEELADWRREAPDAEIVAASKDRHASDALAQAKRRAESGEDVILLVDSLSRLEDTEAAKQIFDGALGQANGSLTVVAALERQS